MMKKRGKRLRRGWRKKLHTRILEVGQGADMKIFQVRFDEEFGQVIGFTKTLSGHEKKDDGCAYAVYGKDGMYELAEWYTMDHPETADQISWPKNGAEWSISDEVGAMQGLEKKVGKDKFRLVKTNSLDQKLFVRVVTDRRMGEVEQNMVLTSLVPMTLKGGLCWAYGCQQDAGDHPSLRYFWPKMLRAIVNHTAEC
mmetsp:Transcript_21963/g.37055  ORF Transcript_21963/g.37055 Transcript_21963/m.37055 type:complete len:197 (-) Transcript_21963:1535-2125(-)